MENREGERRGKSDFAMNQTRGGEGWTLRSRYLVGNRYVFSKMDGFILSIASNKMECLRVSCAWF